MNFTCIIIADDLSDRSIIKSHVDKIDDVLCLGQFGSIEPAENFLMDNSIDLLFLDAELSNISGIEFSNLIKLNIKLLLINTKKKNSGYAIEINTLDLKLNPVNLSNLSANLSGKYSSLTSNFDEEKFISIKSHDDFISIYLADLHYIFSFKSQLYFVLEDETIKTKGTLKKVMSKINPDIFIQIHKSYIVNKNFIEKFDSDRLIINGNQLPIGKRRKAIFMKRMNLLG